MAGRGIRGVAVQHPPNVVLEGYRRDARTRRDRAFRPDSTLEDEPLETLIEMERAAEVRQAFSELTDDEQEVLELRVVADLSSDDAALVLGKRAGAVRMAQTRALNRLRTSLREVDDERR